MKQISIWDIEEEKVNEKEVERLVIENENLVRHTINIFKKKGWLSHYEKTFNEEDIFQIGMIGLLKAAKKFDPSKGYKFSTYAVNSIRNTISNELKKNSVGSNKVYTSYDSYNICYEDYMNENTSPDFHSKKKKNLEVSPENIYQYSRLDIDLLFEKLIEKYPAEENDIITSKQLVEIYGQGYTWPQVAKMTNMTLYQVKKNISKLRGMIPSNIKRKDFVG